LLDWADTNISGPEDCRWPSWSFSASVIMWASLINSLLYKYILTLLVLFL
jgi:hypothetical protein